MNHRTQATAILDYLLAECDQPHFNTHRLLGHLAQRVTIQFHPRRPGFAKRWHLSTSVEIARYWFRDGSALALSRATDWVGNVIEFGTPSETRSERR